MSSIPVRVRVIDAAGNASATDEVRITQYTGTPPATVSSVVAVGGFAQQGLVGETLHQPLTVLVRSLDGLPLAGQDVLFRVMAGKMTLNGPTSTQATVRTDAAGRARVTGFLAEDASDGDVPGEALVVATRPGPAGIPAVFDIAALPDRSDQPTQLSGYLEDSQGRAIPGVEVHLHTPPFTTTTTDSRGHFRFEDIPPGEHHFLLDGSTADLPGTYTNLVFALQCLPGQDNSLGMPIFLPQVDVNSGIEVSETQGGVLTNPKLPGLEIHVDPGMATFPGGSKSGRLAVVAVPQDKTPMPFPEGLYGNFVIAVYPPGTHFDPPARTVFPNLDPRLSPGEKAPIISFDHDLGDYVKVGTATVSPDGSRIISDPGYGIKVAAWHVTPPPDPPEYGCVRGRLRGPPGACIVESECWTVNNRRLVNPVLGDLPPGGVRVEICNVPEDELAGAKLECRATSVTVIGPRLVDLSSSQERVTHTYRVISTREEFRTVRFESQGVEVVPASGTGEFQVTFERRSPGRHVVRILSSNGVPCGSITVNVRNLTSLVDVVRMTSAGDRLSLRGPNDPEGILYSTAFYGDDQIELTVANRSDLPVLVQLLQGDSDGKNLRNPNTFSDYRPISLAAGPITTTVTFDFLPPPMLPPLPSATIFTLKETPLDSADGGIVVSAVSAASSTFLANRASTPVPTESAGSFQVSTQELMLRIGEFRDQPVAASLTTTPVLSRRHLASVRQGQVSTLAVIVEVPDDDPFRYQNNLGVPNIPVLWTEGSGLLEFDAANPVEDDAGNQYFECPTDEAGGISRLPLRHLAGVELFQDVKEQRDTYVGLAGTPITSSAAFIDSRVFAVIREGYVDGKVRIRPAGLPFPMGDGGIYSVNEREVPDRITGLGRIALDLYQPFDQSPLRHRPITPDSDSFLAGNTMIPDSGVELHQFSVPAGPAGSEVVRFAITTDALNVLRYLHTMESPSGVVDPTATPLNTDQILDEARSVVDTIYAGYPIQVEQVSVEAFVGTTPPANVNHLLIVSYQSEADATLFLGHPIDWDLQFLATNNTSGTALDIDNYFLSDGSGPREIIPGLSVGDFGNDENPNAIRSTGGHVVGARIMLETLNRHTGEPSLFENGDEVRIGRLLGNLIAHEFGHMIGVMAPPHFGGFAHPEFNQIQGRVDADQFERYLMPAGSPARIRGGTNHIWELSPISRSYLDAIFNRGQQ